MNWDTFITCAVTGSGQSHTKSDKIPVTPAEIAAACVEAANAGAAVPHRATSHCTAKLWRGSAIAGPM
mgnify:CR=1 FL=1